MSKPWTQDEMDQLKATWPDPRVPNRTLIACLHKGQALGLRKGRVSRKTVFYSDEDDAAIRAGHDNGMHIKGIAAQLGRPPWQITRRIYELKLGRANKLQNPRSFALYLPQDTYAQVQEWSLQEGISASRLLRQLIERTLDERRRARNASEGDGALRGDPSAADE